MSRISGIAIVFVIAVGLTTSGSACAPKVDCKKLKKKTHDCAEEILWALKKKAKGNFDKHENKAKAKKELKEAVSELRGSLDEKIYKPCKKHDGRARDAKEMKACLKKKSCDAFAACFVQFLKAKKK
jgi:hypothetical protein